MRFKEKFRSKQVLKCVLAPGHLLSERWQERDSSGRVLGRRSRWEGSWRRGAPLSLFGASPPTSTTPSIQVHLLERRGSAREPRRGALFQNRRSWLEKVSPEKPIEPSKGSAPRARRKTELRTRPISHLPQVVQNPGPGGDREKKARRFCHLGLDAQSGRSPPLTARSRLPPPQASGLSSLGVLGVGGGGRGAESQREGGGGREQRTYLVQAQVSVASPGAVPRPLARCSAPPGAARARDLRRLSRFLRETTVNPHYCSSCRSGPRIALLRLAAAVLSAGSRRGQGPNLATTAPAEDRCREGACAQGRTCVQESVYACVSVKECACVCEQKG